MSLPLTDVKADVMAMANAFRAASVSRIRLSGYVNSDAKFPGKETTDFLVTNRSNVCIVVYFSRTMIRGM